jgi:endonuclease-3
MESGEEMAQKSQSGESGVRPRGARGRPPCSASLTAVRRKAHRITALLEAAYGSPRHGNKDDPLDELVFILLSQMTTGPSFNRTYERLREACPTWDGLLDIPLRRLKVLIAGAGLVNQKAPRLKSIFKRLRDDFGRVTLQPLGYMADAEVERYLTSLPGIGVKTAKCVMMYSLGRQVLPVDTHVWRVAVRLGLVAPRTPETRIHDALEAVVPAGDRYSFHVNALSHGRTLCLPLRPRCSACPLRKSCPASRAGGDQQAGGRRRGRAAFRRW